jgi:hypothetical protein
MKFVIDRAKWRHAGNPHKGKNHLLNEQGYMCCLGFVELQLGLDTTDILNADMPADTGCENILTRHGTGCLLNNYFASKAMWINDMHSIDSPERERALTELFKKHGHEIVFEGEYE